MRAIQDSNLVANGFLEDFIMLLVILCDGRRYQVVQVPEGANPDRIIAEKYSSWMSVDVASTMTEADSKIERDRGRRKTDSW